MTEDGKRITMRQPLLRTAIRLVPLDQPSIFAAQKSTWHDLGSKNKVVTKRAWSTLHFPIQFPMSYVPPLADRVQCLQGERCDLTVRKMSGGIAFLPGYHMACGVPGGEADRPLPERRHSAPSGGPGTHPFDLTGKAMRGFVMVYGNAMDEGSLADWLVRAIDYAEPLPPMKR